MRLSQVHTATIAILSLILLTFSQFSFAQGEVRSDILKTVCIDPGHGGHDPGCVNGKTTEKFVALDISKRLSAKLTAAFPGMTVVMTRTTDKYIGLGKRSQIANDAKADLFVSIHINSVNNRTASGFSIHCLGKSNNKNRDIFKENMDICKRENAVVLLDEDKDEFFDPDDPASYMILSLMQNVYLEQSLKIAEEMRSSMSSRSPIKKDRGVWQDPFYVLSRASMPAVLVECGFMSNPEDLKTLRSPEGRDKIAESLFKAISSYKAKYDRQIDQEPAGQESVQPAAPEPEVAADAEAPMLYGTQILAASRELSVTDRIFKGQKPIVIKQGKFFKYILGVESDLEKAKEKFEKIRKTFKESFMVSIDGDVVKMLKN